MTDDNDALWFEDEERTEEALGENWRTNYVWGFKHAETSGYIAVNNGRWTLADAVGGAIPAQTFIDLVEARFGVKVKI